MSSVISSCAVKGIVGIFGGNGGCCGLGRGQSHDVRAQGQGRPALVSAGVFIIVLTEKKKELVTCCSLLWTLPIPTLHSANNSADF
ncbi:uncharacterized [Tachysurus ichikawai]